MSETVTRPIIGIENRTAQEVFDIMCDRFLNQSTRSDPAVRDRVKPLEWDDQVDANGRWTSKAPDGFGNFYRVVHDDARAGDFYLFRGSRFYTDIEAKSRAQACHDAAIVAALRTSPPEPASGLPQSAVDVLAERQRQITAEGWTPEHDDKHDRGELANAAACYAIGSRLGFGMSWKEEIIERFWPWAFAWWKPSTPRRNLVKAAALILAEIDRLDRLPTPPAKEPQ